MYRTIFAKHLSRFCAKLGDIITHTINCGRFREGCQREGGQEEGFKSGVKEGWLWVCSARVEAVKVEKRLLCAFYLFPLDTQCSLSKHVFIQLRLHASRGNERLAASAVLIVPPPRPS